MKLLFLSNGHGEDEIAIRIIKRLQSSPHCPGITALPLVGNGYAYTRLGIPLLDRGQKMPSGGFITRDAKQLWRDLREGLLGLTSRQYRLVRNWGQEKGKIVAVGDILPLALAWLSETDYAFVGTAKSEYYLRDEQGWLDSSSMIDRLWGSYYYPWERWLMAHPRCRGVFPRDSLTSKILQQWSILVVDGGNPMMDDLLPSITGDFPQDCLTILLLPGSRFPESLHNWQKIIEAVAAIIGRFPDYKLEFLAAIAPSLPLESFTAALTSQGWGEHSTNKFICQEVFITISQRDYAEYLGRCHLAIAMAGTATEQFVGLGKWLVKEMIDHAFHILKYDFVEIHTDASNLGSIKLVLDLCRNNQLSCKRTLPADHAPFTGKNHVLSALMLACERSNLKRLPNKRSSTYHFMHSP